MITAPNFTIAQSFEPLLTQHIAIEGIYSYLRLYNPETDDIYSPFSQIEWENMFPNVTHNDFKEWASYIDRVILLACDKSTDTPFGMVCIVEDFDQLGSVCFHGGTWCHTPSFTLKMYDSLVNMLDTLIHLGYSITAMCLSNNSKADKLQRSLGFVEYRNDGVKSYKKIDQSKFINSPYYQKFNTSDQFITELKKSPMFQLSLSSKELFHSNLLAWVAENEKTEAIFIEILKLFGVKSATSIINGIRDGKYIVLREHRNFDLCICETKKKKRRNSCDNIEIVPGKEILVLENKFKSIPHKEQLKKYQDKVDSNCHLVLLSLTDKIRDLNNNKIQIDNRIWHFTTYEDYSQKLLDSLSTAQICNLEIGIMKDYAEYVSKICKYFKKELPLNIQNKKWNSILCSDKKLKSIRMDDIWQKMIASLILIRLCEKCIEKKLITDNSKYTVGSNAEDFILGQKNKKGRTGPNLNTIHVGAGFSRSTGFVEIKIHISDNCLFGIQIQNGYYKRLLETVKGNEDVFEKKLSNLKGLFNYENDKTKNIWDDENNNILKAPICPKPDKKGKANIKGFGGYGTTFIAQWKKISDDATVDAVLNVVLNDCNKVRSIIKV